MIAVRPARAHEIAQQMQMKAQQNQEGHFDFLPGEGSRENGDENAKTQVVPQNVMVIAPPVQWMCRILGQPFRYNAQTVHVRHNTSHGHHRPFTLI